MEKFVENPPRTDKELLDVLQDTWNAYEQWFQVSAYTEEEGQEHHRWFKSQWDPIMLSLYKKYTDIIMGSYWCIVRLPKIEEEPQQLPDERAQMQANLENNPYAGAFDRPPQQAPPSPPRTPSPSTDEEIYDPDADLYEFL